ncbi:MAG: hypothetical protein DCC71_15450 [Proteobacteria bacterium]|nr:MAG: hypothetical protein DCC71_15450 [Pseudomonadota bacterium]
MNALEPIAEPGDLVVVASGAGQGLLSSLIRWRTGSGFSHAQLVTRPGLARTLAFGVLEVGWRIREARAFDVLEGRAFVVWRPPLHVELRFAAAGDARRLVAELERRGESRYPWWKLVPYALGRSAAARILRGGPRQVCSVASVYPLVQRGLELYAWDAAAGDYERLDRDAEVRTVTPADVQRNAIERGWRRVYETPRAPVI